ncbi:unnamed protein product [Symbiodinium microadriaticum]|nr:unnamed protein product [Symbiodinium sp. KB8]CAE7865273.1 unnamed protein product [Symbiodinium microadriaticum]
MPDTGCIFRQKPKAVLLGWLLCMAWQCSATAARCKDSDNAESALLQTVAHLADPQRVGSAMRNFSLDAAINSTQKVGNKVKQLFWAGKLGRSSSYVLESSGLHQSTGTNVSRKSSWLERSAGLVGAMLATISITMADILWMIPYITNEVTGRWNSLFFMVLLQVLATLSILLADEEDQSMKRDSHAQRWIDVASAALLWLYAFYLYLDEHVFQKALAVPETTPESEELDETCCDAARGTTKYSRGSFVVLALLNSVDQVIVFVPLVSTGMVTAMELQVGVLISSTLSIAACITAGQLTCVVDTIKAIPLWLLVTFVGVGAFVGGFVSA